MPEVFSLASGEERPSERVVYVDLNVDLHVGLNVGLMLAWMLAWMLTWMNVDLNVDLNVEWKRVLARNTQKCRMSFGTSNALFHVGLQFACWMFVFITHWTKNGISNNGYFILILSGNTHHSPTPACAIVAQTINRINKIHWLHLIN